MKRVPIGLGGYFTPHAFRITRSKKFIAVCSTWCVFLIGLSISPIFLETSARGYFLSIILPVLASLILVYLLVSTCILFYSCAERAVVQALDTAPMPFVAYPESEYPSCLAGVKDESELVPLLKHPELSSVAVATPFGAVKEIPSELVGVAKECVPQLWVQPLHPELGKLILTQMKHLNETAQVQAEKSLDAQKKSAESKTLVAKLESSLADLQKSNEVLNNKLLSLRTRTRGASGGGDFGKMTRQELDVERDRLMDTLRKLDDERRRKGGPGGKS